MSPSLYQVEYQEGIVAAQGGHAQLHRQDKYGLAFTLLSDVGGDVAARYSAWVEKSYEGHTVLDALHELATA